MTVCCVNKTTLLPFYDARHALHRQMTENPLEYRQDMLLTTHVMVAATVGVTVAPDRPWLGFILGFLSHLLIDVVPHGDRDLYKDYVKGDRVRQAVAYVGIDAVSAVLLTLVLVNQSLDDGVRGAVSWAIVGGVLPDLLVALHEHLKVQALKGFHRFHFFFHNLLSDRYGDVPFWAGMGMQALLVVGVFHWFI